MLTERTERERAAQRGPPVRERSMPSKRSLIAAEPDRRRTQPIPIANRPRPRKIPIMKSHRSPAAVRFCWMIVLVIVASMNLVAGRPNLLLITADDLGLQLSCYGDSTIATPHLDELASRSVQFETAYVAQASCSPSRSAMFTGRYPHGNGHYGLANANVGFRVHEHLIQQLLPNVLKRSGYRTGIIGKLHVDPEQAFDFDVRYREGFGSRDIHLQVEQADEFLEASSGQPWFLMFNLFDPHVARQRNADGQRGPQYFPDQVKGIPSDLLSKNDVSAWPWQQIDTPAQRTKIAGYYNCVRRIDTAMGRLDAVLSKRGHRSDTLIVFLGDHGPPFTRGKTSCYEPGLRVPFLVRWPGVSEPHVSSRLVSSVDIYPTFLDAAEVERPAGLHGSSLRKVLERPDIDAEPGSGDSQSGGSVQWRQTLVGEFHYHGATPLFPRRAITDGRYKLIHNLRAGQLSAPSSVDGDRAYEEAMKLEEGHPARAAMTRLKDPPEWELYDLKEDPIEFRNLAGQSEVASIESQLKASLATWCDHTNDPFGDPKFIKAVEQKYRPKEAD